MNFKRKLKYTAIAFSVLIAGLVGFILINPKLCYDEHLRNKNVSRVLITPVERFSVDGETVSWELVYSGFDDKSYENAYITPRNRKILSIKPFANPALTAGFNIGAIIESPDGELAVDSDETSFNVEIAGESEIQFETIKRTRPIHVYGGVRGKQFYYRLEYHIRNEIIEELDIDDGATFSGGFRFTIDDEPYSYAFSKTLYYQRRGRGCIGVPGMP